ncbi:MAG: aminotransferase class III-fold pyridoxal phosphate-dependent enzyme, partial [Rhodospirillales bacterium]|nr:aminotransferase class III-fold pyridoxal phosphate-dependent enzyme [Rhodospirillales bacterium]
TGCHFGKTLIRPEFLKFLRDITEEKGIILIFDEVVTGFRVSPGGAQDYFDVTPDMTTLAKIMAGGLPGGAVAGKKEILDYLDFAEANAAGREKVRHPGTFNANPVSAAAGITTLTFIAGSDSCERANAFADDLRHTMNQVLEDEGLNWSVYGTFSGYHLFTNPRGRNIQPFDFDPYSVGYKELMEGDEALLARLRLGMLINGVDVNGRFSGLTSATHGQAELETTEEAFRRTLHMLKDEEDISL